MMRKVLGFLLMLGLLGALTLPGIGKTPKLALYFSGSQKMIQEIEAAFEKQHGDVLQVYGFKRILAEMAAGKIKADLVWGGEQIMYMQMRDHDWLYRYRSPQTESFSQEYRLGGGYFTPANVMDVVLVYNKRLVSPEDAPTTWDDLLNPRWKGRIAFTDATQAPPALVATCGLLQIHDYDWSLFDALKKNGLLLTASFSEVGDRVTAGEALVGIMPHAGALNQINAAKKKGVESPLAIIWPTQGVIPLIRPIAIIDKQNRSEEQTRLTEEFVDFVLSPEAQKIANKYGMITVRRDVGLPQHVPAKPTMLQLDWDWIYQYQSEIRGQFEQIFHNN